MCSKEWGRPVGSKQSAEARKAISEGVKKAHKKWKDMKSKEINPQKIVNTIKVKE